MLLLLYIYFLSFIYIYIYIYYLLLLLLFYYYYIIFFIFVWGPKNGLQQMPPLYNTYGAGVLRSKFYKDKQNWTSETDLVEV